MPDPTSASSQLTQLTQPSMDLPPNSITTERTLTNQQLGTLASNLSTDNSSLVTALNAIATAINAKPSAS